MSKTDKRTLKLTDNEMNAIERSIEELLSTEPCPVTPDFKNFMIQIRNKIGISRKVDLSDATIELSGGEAFSICGFIFAVEDKKWAKGYKDVRNKIETAFIGKPIDLTNNIKIG